MSTRVPNCNQFVSLAFPCTGVVCPTGLRELLGSVEQNELTGVKPKPEMARPEKALMISCSYCECELSFPICTVGEWPIN